jgi:hypothetical protein
LTSPRETVTIFIGVHEELRKPEAARVSPYKEVKMYHSFSKPRPLTTPGLVP